MGWYAEINRSRGSKPEMTLEQAFSEFHKSIKELSRFNLFAPTKKAEARYKAMPADAKRVGREDCKLAAHAAEVNATVITLNTDHFGRIPGVKFDDWSK